MKSALLPMAFLGRVESIGNAAGEGAKIYARNFPLFEASSELALETEYIELTLSPAFNDYFVGFDIVRGRGVRINRVW